MSLILESNKSCPYGNSCPYNTTNECWGAKADRFEQFICEFIVDGVIAEGGYRNPLDKTGNMKVIME